MGDDRGLVAGNGVAGHCGLRARPPHPTGGSDFGGPEDDSRRHEPTHGIGAMSTRDEGETQVRRETRCGIGRVLRRPEATLAYNGARKLEARAAQLGQSAHAAYLPGDNPPEVWVWELLRRNPDRYGQILGMAAQALRAKLDEQENLFSGAVDKPAAIAEGKLNGVAEATAHTVAEVMRLVAGSESKLGTGEVFDLVNSIEDMIGNWRSADN